MIWSGRRILIYLVALIFVGFISGSVGAATYSNGVFSDPGNGFRINVPTNWSRQNMSNNDSNTHLFISQDENVAVGVTTFPDGGKGSLGQILSAFQQSAIAGSTQIAEQATSINNINGQLRAYRIQNSDGPIIVGAFATHGQGKSYVLWSMIPEGIYQSRAGESDALLNSFAMMSSPQAKPKPGKIAIASQATQEKTQATSVQPNRKKQAPPVTKPSTAQSSNMLASSSQVIVPGPETTSYKAVKNVPEFIFEVPTSYTGSVKGNQLIMQSSDISRSGLTIVLQKMARTVGGLHENLEKSVERALSQLRSAPSAQLLERKEITVDGVPAVWIELTYEGEGGQQRMAQVLIADNTAVYWLGFNGPLAAFNMQVEDLNHAVQTVRLSDKPAPAFSSTTNNAGAHEYQGIVLDDSMFEFSYPKTFAVFQKEEGQSQWADPAEAYGNKVVMVVQTMGRNFGNTAKSVHDGLVAQVNSSASATLVSTDQAIVNGISAYKLHFTLAQGTGKSHFRYLVLDVQGPNVPTVSFVGPEALLSEIDAHYAELLRSVKPIAGSTSFAGVQLAPVKSASAGFVEPNSPEEAFNAVQQTVRAGDWEGFVRLLHTSTVEIEMSRFFGVLAEENDLNIAGLSPREAMLKVFQEVPQASKNKAFMGKPAKITGTRKEDENRVLVMAKFDDGGEQYLWMFREAGNWRWMYK